MKKYLLVLIIVLVFSSLAFAQSITLNNIGMYVDATGDQTGEAGETVHVRVDYTTSLMDNVQGPHYSGSNHDKVRIFWYDANTPTTGTYNSGEGVTIANWASGGIGTNKIATFTFSIPSSAPTDAESFQVMFGLYGEDEDFNNFDGIRYSSYITYGSYTACSGNPPANYYEYIDFIYDTTTETPTMTLPADNQHDNNPTEIEFFLPEAATDGSVKLSFTRSGEDHECTIVSEAQGTHNFNINPSNLSSASEISSVSGGNSLTQDVAYTVTIEYQDALGNPLASNSNTGYVYDTVTQTPTLDLPVDYSLLGLTFDVQYDQPETAYEGTVIVTFTRTGGSPDSDAPHVFEVTSETAGTDIVLGFKGDELNGETNTTQLSGGNLDNNAIYTIRIEYKDLAQNTVAYDQNTDITYNGGATFQASGGDYNAGTSFNPGSQDNAFFILKVENNTAGDKDIDKITIDMLGSYSSGDIDLIEIWRSTDAVFGSDTSIGSGNPDINDEIEFDFVNQAISSSAPTWFFFTIDVNSGASGNDEIGLEIEVGGIVPDPSTLTVAGLPITGSTHPLPVTLSSFTVVLSGQPVIYWTTQSETNNAYWNIYRGISQNLGQAIQINYGDLIPGQGTVTEPTDYSYIDNYPIAENTTYWYWLECVDNAGEADILGPVSLFIPEGNGNNGTPATPDDYGLKQNYPNPFNPDTKINFALVEDSPVRLTIYNIKGEKIKTIFEDFVPADMVQTAYWDGKDGNGKRVASGVYLYRLRTNKTEFNKRMLLMK